MTSNRLHPLPPNQQFIACISESTAEPGSRLRKAEFSVGKPESTDGRIEQKCKGKLIQLLSVEFNL